MQRNSESKVGNLYLIMMCFSPNCKYLDFSFFFFFFHVFIYA